MRRLNIEGPKFGNWFGIGFISWTDPNNERIEQQGLSPSCETLLLSEMVVIQIQPIIIHPELLHSNRLLVNSTESMSYKFYVPNNIAIVTWHMSITKPCQSCPDIGFYVQSNGMPSLKSYIQNTIMAVNQTGEVSIDFYPQENSWHYVDLEFVLIDGNVSSSGAVNNSNGFVEFSVWLTFHEDQTAMDIENISSLNDIEIGNSGEQLIERIGRKFLYFPLLRQTYREFFMFDYDLLPDENGTTPVSLNLTGGLPTAMKFDVGDVYDIGGTLSFAIAMKLDIKGNQIESPHRIKDDADEAELIAEKLVDTEGGYEETKLVLHSNQTIIICMRLDEPGIPQWPDKCVYGNNVFPAASIINNTDTDTGTGLVHVPFPESGKWWVTLGLFCHGAETAARITIIDSVKEFIKKNVDLLYGMNNSCSCTQLKNYYIDCLLRDKCLAQLNETETLKIKECMMDSKCTERYQEISKKFEIHQKFVTEQSVALDHNCNSTVVFTISSSPCVAGRCGRNGRCYHYMSGGFVFSTCLCLRNYRGWDCTEDSQVPSSLSLLVASLMLTLSNLLFIPSIYFAIRREYYTESVIYFFAMFFSTFYHACDSGEEEFSFCLVKIGVLQFCDFYCGLLAIWVTLIAMSHVRQTLVSLLHMFGAILLAFGTELNKQSLWVFLAPALTGVCIISFSWGFRCRKTKKWFPSKNYLALYLPLGAILVMVGLVCYAFLQTKQNYHIVHSVWHMVMALSLLCLLPNRETFQPKC
uniref:CSON002056 protein n=1 Tax=Culicoides sonorensis TaxID=179676 RepID=A0A336KYA0_CULSO